jgi:hypothetical protein
MLSSFFIDSRQHRFNLCIYKGTRFMVAFLIQRRRRRLCEMIYLAYDNCCPQASV